MIKMLRHRFKPEQHPAALKRVLAAVLLAGIAWGGLLPSAAYAQDPVELELGGTGAIPWAITDVMPCDSGSQTVTLHNAGTADGTLSLWISDISDEEYSQPESETGDTAEPGELGQNLLFDLAASSGLSTNITMPATIYGLPQSAADANYVRIALNSGATVTLDWQWQLPCGTGNDAQGDRLSFAINYSLEEIPVPEPKAPKKWGTSDHGNLVLDIFGRLYSVTIDRFYGTVFGSYLFSSEDNTILLGIDRFTSILCGDTPGYGNMVTTLVVNIAQDPPAPAPGMAIIGPVYNITGYTGGRQGSPCPQVNFSKPVVLSLQYDPDSLPDNTSGVYLCYYDAANGEWVELSPAAGPAQPGFVSGLLTHLTSFAVVARTGEEAAPEPPSPNTSSPVVQYPEPAPTRFTVRDLSVIPNQEFVRIGSIPLMIETGKSATAVARVANDGRQSGSYEAVLKLNDIVEFETAVRLEPGQVREVVFNLSGGRDGTNTVRIENLEKEFTASRWYNWPVIAGMATALVFIILGIYRLAKRRSRQ